MRGPCEQLRRYFVMPSILSRSRPRSVSPLVFGYHRIKDRTLERQAILRGDRLWVSDDVWWFVSWVDPNDGTPRPQDGPVRFGADNTSRPSVLRVAGSTWTILNGSKRDFRTRMTRAANREAETVLDRRLHDSNVVELIMRRCDVVVHDDDDDDSCVIC